MRCKKKEKEKEEEEEEEEAGHDYGADMHAGYVPAAEDGGCIGPWVIRKSQVGNACVQPPYRPARPWARFYNSITL